MNLRRIFPIAAGVFLLIVSVPPASAVHCNNKSCVILNPEREEDEEELSECMPQTNGPDSHCIQGTISCLWDPCNPT